MKDFHNDLIKAFQEYSKWNLKFIQTRTEESGTKSRYFLNVIRRQAFARRKEIRELQKEYRKARNGKIGRPPKIHTP